MPSINKLINYNLATSTDGANAGFFKNLVFLGDESTINTGSSTWDNKLPYGLPDADLYGTASYARSGSAGFEFNGTTNYVTWDTGSFFALNPTDGLVNDGYTLSVTLTPDNSTIPYTGFGGGAINIHRPYALWQPNEIQTVGYLPGIQLNDVCPGGGQKSYWVNYGQVFGGQTPYLRNRTYYDAAPDLNLNLVFVFSGATEAQGPDVTSYVNGVQTGYDSLPLSQTLPNIFLAQFGKRLSASTGDSSIADDRNTNCGSVSSNLPFFNFKGYVRDFAIWNRPLVGAEVEIVYRTLNRFSEINNS